MRRKIELYINGTLADLSDQGLVLFNYSLTDLQRPTAVKNSYSKQITLPGTPTNDAIFGHISRLDRSAVSGFDPLTRTPFTIYDAQGQILTSGYLKLDQVTRKRGIVTGYKVSLYGGLGSFLYALSYNEDGDKLTLADLDYLDGSADELDFNITRANVIAAWNRLANGIPTKYDSIWDVINFAPAYNGCPDGDFSADKAIALPATLGVPSTQTDGDKTYSANGSYVLVNLAQPHTEWDMKDLRCYLQRPVLSMRAFLVAVQKWATANGYTFDYSGIPVNQYRALWKTLPTLPSLGTMKQTEGDVTASYVTQNVTTSGDVLYDRANFSGVTASMQMTAKLISCQLAFKCGSTYPNPGYLRTRFKPSYSADEFGYHTVFFIQVLGYNGTTLVAASDVQCYTNSELAGIYNTPQKMAEAVGFSMYSTLASYESSVRKLDNVFLASNTALSFFNFTNVQGSLEAKGVAISSLRMAFKSYRVYGIYKAKPSYSGGGYEPFSMINAADTGMLPYFFSSTSTTAGARSQGTAWVSASAKAHYQTSTKLRSGALIEKAKLLSSKHTPADYLLSLGTQFGWMFQYDEVTKKLTLKTRNDFFNTGEDIIDLSGRIDTSQEIAISPCYAGARIYEFSPEMAMGHWAEEYARIYGYNYGIQRVNTGYAFDGTPENLLAQSAFRAAATILENGPYWNIITDGSSYRPSILLDKGNTYTLYDSTGASKEFNVPGPSSAATFEYYNDYNHEGYDNEFAWKLDLHDADGKPLDGEDILVYYSGSDTYSRFYVSDDIAVMDTLNNGKMCWYIYPNSISQRIANFHRYYTDTEWGVQKSLDFGTPREVDIPFVNFLDDSSAYESWWQAFIRDRYNRDTKVMKCRVNLEGLQVGPELLRRFFWYENSYWVLNKITNYSLTTYDPAECEFVQVRNIENYTNGQVIPW